MRFDCFELKLFYKAFETHFIQLFLTGTLHVVVSKIYEVPDEQEQEIAIPCPEHFVPERILDREKTQKTAKRKDMIEKVAVSYRLVLQ